VEQEDEQSSSPSPSLPEGGVVVVDDEDEDEEEEEEVFVGASDGPARNSFTSAPTMLLVIESSFKLVGFSELSSSHTDAAPLVRRQI